jgi:hypothetical protein
MAGYRYHEFSNLGFCQAAEKQWPLLRDEPNEHSEKGISACERSVLAVDRGYVV